jgi:hypothetical protein
VNRVRLLGRLLVAAGIALGAVAIVVWRSGGAQSAQPTASPTRLFAVRGERPDWVGVHAALFAALVSRIRAL